MHSDRYTKVVLSIISAAVVARVVQNIIFLALPSIQKVVICNEKGGPCVPLYRSNPGLQY